MILQHPPTPFEYWNGSAWVPKPPGPAPTDWVKASMAEINDDPAHDPRPMYYARVRAQ